ncbi:hypothetical protein L7F22_026702 [Adiantum nelumboides]|nr:hypothetical protein [Adiantum nelumboides]MCO5572941.1 hypothetical protein [Adiantum nelumboides]
MGSLEVDEGGMKARAWAAKDKGGVLEPFDLQLRAMGAEDVVVRVLFCGICHTDLHQLRDDYGFSRYPMVAGHEVTGLIYDVGNEAKHVFSKGDRVGVGCIVGSCGDCGACCDGIEQYCKKKKWTYNDVYFDGNPTQGGFADYMVVNFRFVVHIPKNLPLDAAAPLLCAGITVYSPMKFYGMDSSASKGKTCGVMGLGGVGHMVVKFAKAFGLHVTVISSSPSKEREACEVLGADAFLLSSDELKMKTTEQTLDFIIDTIPSVHPLEPYLELLKVNGKLVMVGVAPGPMQFMTPMLLLGRRSIGGSFIGSIEEMQEMLNFVAEKDVKCMIEVVPIDYINQAFERLDKNDVRYRFVVDIVGNSPEKEGSLML